MLKTKKLNGDPGRIRTGGLLLAKYADEGVLNLDDPNVLRIPPLTELGTPVQLIKAFGGKEGFVEAVHDFNPPSIGRLLNPCPSAPRSNPIQNIMRQDTGVDGVAQRISQLCWMFFLKIIDDQDQELELTRDAYASPIPERYR